MSRPLQVVALISGGKDSLFSLLHCLQNGHRVVALANLHPPARAPRPDRDASSSASMQEKGEEEDEEEDDMNSFMYQTIGHQIIPLYADALDLPLYRRKISGSAIQIGRYYDTSDRSLQYDDETEDLFRLLQDVLNHHPGVNAVSSGAILSTYQRTRVESVAIRLGLIPLSYLWQYPALPPPQERADSLTGLLDDMAAAGCDAKVIKIASGGMKETLLWSGITDSRTRGRLVAGMAPFYLGHELWLRGAVLGEGGEYETLAVDGPRPLWKQRLVFNDREIKTVTEEGGVHRVRLGGVAMMEKDWEIGRGNHEALVRTPKMFDVRFEAVRAHVISSRDGPSSMTKDPAIGYPGQPYPFQPPDAAMNICSAHIHLSNVVADDVEVDAAGQMSHIVRQVKAFLSSIDPPVSTSDAVSALLLLSSMSDFAAVNHVYASLFPLGEPNPPARITVAVDLSSTVKVSLSLVIARRPRSQLRGLHIQSRSYWAPANIGPYSQAICEPLAVDGEDVNATDASQLEFVHIAGQIPLVPQSMDISQATFQEQAVLSLQHLWRIGQERGADLWPWGIALLSSTDQNSIRAEVAHKAWVHAHSAAISVSNTAVTAEAEEKQDIWFAQHDRFSRRNHAANSTTCGKHLHALPNYAVVNSLASVDCCCPPFLAAEVRSLPRNASIEWWSLGVANIASSCSRVSVKSKSWPWGSVGSLALPAGQGEGSEAMNSVSFVYIFLFAGATPESLPSLSWIMEELEPTGDTRSRRLTCAHASLFWSAHSGLRVAEAYSSFDLSSCPATIPCRRLWASASTSDCSDHILQPIDAALLLRVEYSSDRPDSQQPVQ